MADKTVELGTVFSGKIDPTLGTSIDKVQAAIVKLNKAVTSTKTAFSGQQATFSAIGAALNKVAQSSNIAATSQTALTATFRQSNVVAITIASGFSKLKQAIDTGSVSAKTAQASYISLNARMKSLLGIHESLLAQAQAVAISRKKTAMSLQSEASSATVLANKYKALIAAMDKGTVSTKQADVQYKALSAEMNRMSAAEQRVTNKLIGRTTATKGLTAATKAQIQATSYYNNTIGATTSRITAATRATKTYGGVLQRLGRSFKTLASYMIAGKGIMLFTQAITGGVKAIAEFDQALHNLVAITGATKTEILSIRGVLVDLAQTTKFSVGELATGMVLLGQAGFTASEAVAAITPVALLASATLSGLEQTAQLLTTTVRAYNLEALESSRVADVMANAINKSKLTIDKLNTAFNYVGVTASQAGLSIEQTAAAMMVLANNGLRASTIGTGLRQVLSRLLSPNKKLRQAFAEQNIELSKVNPAIVGFEKSLGELSSVLWDTEKGTVDVGKAFGLFGLRGAQAAAAIIKSYVGGQFDTALEQVRKMGTAQEMATEQSKGLAFKFKNLQDVAGTLAVAVGDAGVLGVLRGLVDLLKNSLLGISNLISSDIGKLVTSFTLLAAAMYATMIAGKMLFGGAFLNMLKQAVLGVAILQAQFITLAASAGVASAATTTFMAVISMVNPVFAVIAALSAVVVGIYAVVTATARAIEARQKELGELNKTIQGYNLYAKSLQKLVDDEKDGIDTKDRQTQLIKRLRGEYKELAPAIDTNAASVEELIVKLEELQQVKEIERIKNLVETYSLASIKINELKKRYAEMAKVAGEAIAKVIFKNKGLNKVNKDAANSMQDLVGSAIEFGHAQGKTDAEVRASIGSIVKAMGASGEYAKVIEEGVIKALDKKIARLKKAKKEQKSYTELLIESSNKAVASIKIVSDAEGEVLEKYKQGVVQRVEALKSGALSAEEFRLQQREAEKQYVKDIIVVRKKHIDDLLVLDSSSAKDQLAAAEALRAAKKAGLKIEKKDIEYSYDVKLAALKAHLVEAGATETESMVALAVLRKEYLEKEIAAKNKAMEDLLVSKNFDEAAYAKIYKDLKKLEEEHYKLKGDRREEDLENQMAALQVEIDLHMQQLTKLAGLGDLESKQAEEHWTAMNAAQGKYNALALLQNKASYEEDIIALETALQEKEITQKEYNERLLITEQEHWNAIIKETETAIQKLKSVGIQDGKVFDDLVKVRLDAIKALSDANKKHADDVINANSSIIQSLEEVNQEYSNITEQGIAEYETAIAMLELAFKNGVKSEKEYQTESAVLFSAHMDFLIKAQQAYIEKMKASGATTLEVAKAEKKLVDLQLEHVDGLNKMTAAIDKHSSTMKVSNSAWEAFAKKVGISADELKKLLKPAMDAAEAGRKAASVSESAWAAFARQVGLTVQQLKDAVSGIMSDLKEAEEKVSSWGDVKVGNQSAGQRIEDMQGLSTEDLEAQRERWGSVTSGGITMSDASARLLARTMQEWIAAETEARTAEEKAADAELRAAQLGTEESKQLAEELRALADALRAYAEQKALGYSAGGIIPGTGTRDTVPILTTPGEIVIPNDAIKENRIGEFLASLKGGFNIPKIKIPVQQMLGGTTQTGAVDTINVNLRLNNKDHVGSYPIDVGKALIQSLQQAAMVSA